MEYVLAILAVAAVVVLVAWQVTGRGRVFVIRVRHGVPAVARGKVSQNVIAELADVLRRHNVRQGSISGVNRGGRVALEFSRSIPANCRQALRNVWAIHPR